MPFCLLKGFTQVIISYRRSYMSVHILLNLLHNVSGLGKRDKMGLVAIKPVFGVSDKAIFKPVSSATEAS